ncbi:MAG: phenylalanine--tRNA ligase beta subunit-related protein [Candidatus Micrarchaeota archaeon]
MEKIRFKVYPEAKEKLEGLKVGYILFEDVVVRRDGMAMDNMIEVAMVQVEEKFPNAEAIPKDNVIKAIRKLFSTVGLDPTKDRASSEALIRRIVSGKGIERINTVVDTNNVISMTTGYPCGVYDAANVKGIIRLHIGKEGGKYIGIGGKDMSTDDRLLTKDDISIFGGPTADSMRTAIHAGTSRVLMLIYSPPGVPEKMLRDTMEEAKAKMSEITGGKVKDSGIYTCTR